MPDEELAVITGVRFGHDQHLDTIEMNLTVKVLYGLVDLNLGEGTGLAIIREHRVSDVSRLVGKCLVLKCGADHVYRFVRTV